MKAISQSEMISLFLSDLGLNRSHFKKFGFFKYELVSSEQIVDTVINDQIETTNLAKPGDYILTGAKNEKYVIGAKKFQTRYTIKDEFSPGYGVAEASGECYASIYTGEPFSFIAAWGEEMICNTGDYLASPDKEISEVYRIEKSAFLETYKEVAKASSVF